MCVILTVACAFAMIIVGFLLLGCSICAFAPGVDPKTRTVSIVGIVVCLGILIGGYAAIANLNSNSKDP